MSSEYADDSVYRVTKQESTKLKIELAAEVIRHENTRRKKLNKKNKRAIKEGNASKLPILKPSFIGVSTRRATGIIGGTSCVTQSNKFLCGKLSKLCAVMRKAGITYPWRESEATA